MVVRDKVGRKRYIIFRVNAERTVSRKDFEKAISSSFRMKGPFQSVKPKLINFDGEVGILRCLHTGKERAIEVLTAITHVGDMDVKVDTVKTSGTIRKAKAVVNSLASDLE